ncbi:MAG TPA: hypothetical protein VF487_01510 [Chitinophagaceae bacterium]
MKTAEELSDFVKSKLKRGYPEGELRNDLLREGYTAEQVQKAIYNPPKGAKDILRAEQKKLDNNPLWYMISAGFIITGIAIKSVKYYRENSFSTMLIAMGVIGLFAKIFLALKASANDTK